MRNSPNCYREGMTNRFRFQAAIAFIRRSSFHFLPVPLINNSVLVFYSSNKEVLFVILKRIVQL